MNLMDYIIDFHVSAKRQGPGSTEDTLKALGYLPQITDKATILDIGSGTGEQTFTLAEHSPANIVAVDMLLNFLDELVTRRNVLGLENRIKTVEADMDNLDFPEESFDVIWSEGAIYNIGFKRGLTEWRRYLKDNGYIVVSEISWTTDERPAEIESYWIEAYSEIDTMEEKLKVIRNSGYEPITHFELSEEAWLENYYNPMEERIESFLQKYNNSEDVKTFINLVHEEIEVYKQYHEYFNYVFYIAKKI